MRSARALNPIEAVSAEEPGGADPLRSSGVRTRAEPPTRETEDEATIATMLLSGDPHGAIARAARAYGAAIGRFCYLLLGAQGEAEEAAQETLVAAFHAAASYRGEGTARGWLFTIARRTCAQRLEARTRQARRRELMPLPIETTDASFLHDEAELAASIRAGMDTLAPADRDILALRYEAEQSFREIGRALGIDEAAARKRVSRALARLREALARDAAE